MHPLLRKACELEVKKVRALFRRKHQDFLDFCTKHPRTSAALMPLLELNGATCGVCFRLPAAGRAAIGMGVLQATSRELEKALADPAGIPMRIANPRDAGERYLKAWYTYLLTRI
jgi:hypothetical protein